MLGGCILDSPDRSHQLHTMVTRVGEIVIVAGIPDPADQGESHGAQGIGGVLRNRGACCGARAARAGPRDFRRPPLDFGVP